MKKFITTNPVPSSQINDIMSTATDDDNSLPYALTEMTQAQQRDYMDHYVRTSVKGDFGVDRGYRDPAKLEHVEIAQVQRVQRPVYFPDSVYKIGEIKYKLPNSEKEETGYLNDFLMFNTLSGGIGSQPTFYQLWTLTKTKDGEEERGVQSVPSSAITEYKMIEGKKAKQILSDLNLIP